MFNFHDLKDHITSAVGGVEKFRAIGDILQYALPWSALMAIALAGLPFAHQWLIVVLGTTIITHTMKYVFNLTSLGRRPNGGEDSFPSGHTSSAFSGAWVFVAVFGWAWGAIPLVLAALVGMSRVVSKNHHWRDAIAGAVVAGAVAHYVFV